MNILVADDHQLIREALRNVLAQLDEDVTVIEAPDCDQTLHQADEQADLDLVLLDLRLPGIGGFETLSRLRDSHPELPVVILSAHDERETVLAVLSRGAAGFVPKSSSNPVILNALRLVLAGGVYVPPHIVVHGGERGSGPEAPVPPRSLGSVRDLGLTERQLQVLALLMKGYPNKLICRELDLAEGTVKVHVSAVLKSLDVDSRTRAVVSAEAFGLKLDPEGRVVLERSPD
ncbi:MAG: response regulator transcription factor [Pseudomonadota bacterium]|nr:response regulator transcription factor [Pseudomonadota bacterium]